MTTQNISAEQANLIAHELKELKKIDSNYPLKTRSDFHDFVNKIGTCANQFSWKSLSRIAQSPAILDLLASTKDNVVITRKSDLYTRMYTVTFISNGKSASYQY